LRKHCELHQEVWTKHQLKSNLVYFGFKIMANFNHFCKNQLPKFDAI